MCIANIDLGLKSILPISQNINASLSAFAKDDISTLSLLDMCHAPLSSIPNFENLGVVTLLPPLREQLFSIDECSQLQKIYSQLYPNVTISHVTFLYFL